MATAKIVVTACDNELYLVAVNASSTQSFQLVHIMSGNLNAVNVTVNVSAGTYNEQPTLNGVNSPLNVTQNVSIPAGTYSLLAVGINWNSIQGFSFSVNGATANSSSVSAPGPLGANWTPSLPSAFSVS